MIWVEELPSHDMSCKACSSGKVEVRWQEYAVAVMCSGALQVMCTWIFSLVGVCCSLPARTLYCWNCRSCKYRHGLVVRLAWLGNGNHSNFQPGFEPLQNPQEFAKKNYIFKISLLRIITSPLLRIITNSLLHHYDINIKPSLHHHYIIIRSLLKIHYYKFIITNYYIIITHYYIIIIPLLLINRVIFTISLLHILTSLLQFYDVIFS